MSSSASKEHKMRRFTGSIPEDLISNILLRLPSKTLVVLKSVSKSWLSLISSHHFAKSHLAITAVADEEILHIVHSYEKKPRFKESVSLINLDTCQLITQLNFPFTRSFTLVGSACGIVCFYASLSLDVENMYLWNPATNLHKLVPSQSPCLFGDLKVSGFGFDEIDNDFKIVRIVVRNKPLYRVYPHNYEEICVEVYSSNMNVWRTVEQEAKPIDDVPYIDNYFYVSINGGLLCCAGFYGIITFDLHTEVLDSSSVKYPVPTFEANINNFDVYDARARITNFNDSIAVIIFKQTGFDHNGYIPIHYHNDYKLDLWALDDKASLGNAGIQASWTLIFSIHVKLPLQRVHGYLNIAHLLLLLADEDWCLYNPDTKEPRYFVNKFRQNEVYKYTKSLFTIPGFKQLNSNALLCDADK